MKSSSKQLTRFSCTITDHYAHSKRSFPWRKTTDPYHILVSEIMLQQTQTSRVLIKYPEFITTFPSINSLAAASFQSVFSQWQGLGYNRRAKYLHQSAQIIVSEYNGSVPKTHKELITLPGVGSNTAGAVLAYAFNERSVFIETNIRTVFLHEFYRGRSKVTDKEILNLVEQTLPNENYRDWYYALTDYGVHLKDTIGNQNARSKHYTKQSAFEGSKRQIRADILRRLLIGSMTLKELCESYPETAHDVQEIVKQLESEKMISKIGETYMITGEE